MEIRYCAIPSEVASPAAQLLYKAQENTAAYGADQAHSRWMSVFLIADGGYLDLPTPGPHSSPHYSPHYSPQRVIWHQLDMPGTVLLGSNAQLVCLIIADEGLEIAAAAQAITRLLE